MIRFFFEDIETINFKRNNFKRFIVNLLKQEGFLVKDINIIFCSDDYLLEMNTKYLQHNFLTDIITFDYKEGNTVIGELYISFDRIQENACKYKVDLFEEVSRVIIHGILHLAGYKDKTIKDRAVMKEKEDLYLTELMENY